MNQLIELIYEYGVIAMFFIILLEYACFPVSSEIVLPLSGAVASMNGTNFFLILPLSVLAGLLGTSICYLVGRIGGGACIHKLTTKFPKTKKGIDASYEKFEVHGPVIVCLGRLIPLCRTYIAFIAGATKLRATVFYVASFIGITIWNFILIGLGYLFRENYQVVSYYYARYKHYLLPMILVLCIFMIYRSYRKKQKARRPL